MATSLSSLDLNHVPDASKMRLGIVVTEWNSFITNKLLDGAYGALRKYGVADDNIQIFKVPGSIELTFGAQQLIKYGDVDAVIVLGCVIRGGTPHFDYVCDSVTQGITELNATQDIPVIFGVLTTDNQEQAEERAGGKLGNKGEESAISAIKMIDFVCKVKK
ncbi:MAG: 6,7-dimethyl-8-ribityllumazine synthase [Tannerella sp.]|jgi:6,7-dimethyl-8-ribityllumazine synthase|nr:6,7-dimethyl-8-ribityllumazine synthase [Tannerella sp.]